MRRSKRNAVLPVWPPIRPDGDPGVPFDLEVNLEKTIRGGDFFVDEADSQLKIASVLEIDEAEIEEITESFVKKHAQERARPVDSDGLEVTDLEMGFHKGRLLARRMKAEADRLKREPSVRHFDVVEDCPNPDREGCLLNSINTFRQIPSALYSITDDMFLDRYPSNSARVRLRHYLFESLGRMSSDPKIHEHPWVTSSTITKGKRSFRVFPVEFENKLKDYFLEFFQLHYEELNEENPVNIPNLPFLRRLRTDKEKREKFLQMSLAKKIYNSKIFESELRDALKEFRASKVYDIIDSYGRRKHKHFKRNRTLPKHKRPF